MTRFGYVSRGLEGREVDGSQDRVEPQERTFVSHRSVALDRTGRSGVLSSGGTGFGTAGVVQDVLLHSLEGPGTPFGNPCS